MSPETIPTAIPDKSSTALIVDDNFYNRDVCSIALKHVGYMVTEAEDGLKALNLLDAQTYDLLVLDLAMPELDGLGVLRRLHKQEKHNRMSVIVMTANPHMTLDDALNDVDFVMNKPIEIEAFARLAQRVANAAKVVSTSS